MQLQVVRLTLWAVNLTRTVQCSLLYTVHVEKLIGTLVLYRMLRGGLSQGFSNVCLVLFCVPLRVVSAVFHEGTSGVIGVKAEKASKLPSVTQSNNHNHAAHLQPAETHFRSTEDDCE